MTKYYMVITENTESRERYKAAKDAKQREKWFQKASHLFFKIWFRCLDLRLLSCIHLLAYSLFWGAGNSWLLEPQKRLCWTPVLRSRARSEQRHRIQRLDVSGITDTGTRKEPQGSIFLRLNETSPEDPLVSLFPAHSSSWLIQIHLYIPRFFWYISKMLLLPPAPPTHSSGTSLSTSFHSLSPTPHPQTCLNHTASGRWKYHLLMNGCSPQVWAFIKRRFSLPLISNNFAEI